MTLPSDRSGRNTYRLHSGLTLADTMIVIMIIGILAAVAAPRFADLLQRSRAEAAARRIKADLGLVRRRALSSSSSQTVTFSPSENRYLASGLEHLNHANQSYAVHLNHYPYNAQLVSASFGGGADLQFHRDGRPASGGTILVQAGQFQCTVTVDPDTGRATIP